MIFHLSESKNSETGIQLPATDIGTNNNETNPRAIRNGAPSVMIDAVYQPDIRFFFTAGYHENKYRRRRKYDHSSKRSLHCFVFFFFLFLSFFFLFWCFSFKHLSFFNPPFGYIIIVLLLLLFYLELKQLFSKGDISSLEIPSPPSPLKKEEARK